jgi:hypothetical protein
MSAISAFTDESIRNESYLRLAYIIKRCFPETELIVTENNKDFVFDYSYGGEHLLKIDAQGVTYTATGKIMEFSGIKEGNIQTVAEIFLRRFAERDFEVFRSPRGDENVRTAEITRLRRPVKMMVLNTCPSCQKIGFLRKLYVGARDDKKYNLENYLHAGEKRKRDTGFYICLDCQWRGDKF